MRNLGLILLMGGILAFLYCTAEMSKLEPMAGDAGIADYLRNSAGRLQLGRYVAAGALVVGGILTLFPRARP